MTFIRSAFEWKKFTVAATAFTAAATTQDIELFRLGSTDIIHGVKIKHSTAFSGGTLSALTLSVGVPFRANPDEEAGLPADLTKYASPFDAFQTAGKAVFQLTHVLNSEIHSGAYVTGLAGGTGLTAAAGDFLVGVNGEPIQTVTFVGTESPASAIASAINSQTTGLVASPHPLDNPSGFLRITSNLVGPTSSVEIDAASTSHASIGFFGGHGVGSNPSPVTSIRLAASATGDTLDNVNTGSVDVWVLALSGAF